MSQAVRRPGRVVLVGAALAAVLVASTAWGAEEGGNPKKLKVGMILTLEGVDHAGALYEQVFHVSGKAFLPFTEARRFQIIEVYQEQEAEMLLSRWDRQGNMHVYGAGGSECTALVNGPVGTTFQCDNWEGEVVAVGETLTVPAGTYEDCVKIEKRRISGSEPWIEWWKPGFFVVKWTDWFVRPPTEAPVEWELVSVERVRP